MKTINVGVVGVGAMGENHVRVYHKMEEANLVAVSDVSERALKKIEKKYKIISIESSSNASIKSCARDSGWFCK